MTERIIIHELEPESYQAMMGLEKYLNQTGLKKIRKELIKIRATLRDFFIFAIFFFHKVVPTGQNQFHMLLAFISL
jgi:hypothetical protein